METQAQVIVVGAGPSGLSTALFLAERGCFVTVLERNEGTPMDPRAATFHPPTMEILAPSGVTDELHRRGIIGPNWQNRDREKGVICEFDLDVLSDETPYPYRLQCEQHKFVEILREKLKAQPRVTIVSGVEVTGLTQDDGAVTLQTSKGGFRAAYVVGADGGRSVVRKSAGISFEGFTYQERFLVITTTHDFSANGYAVSNYVSDPTEWAALFQVPGNGDGPLWRVVFPTRPEDREEDLLSFEKARQHLAVFMPKEGGYDVVHTNLYTVHQRVAGTFRQGKVLLVGDAAHVNNPLGGMGMNFGIHDAANLAPKLAAVVLEGEDEAILDLFDRQRRFAATKFLQAMTIQNKQALEEKDQGAREQRQQQLRETAADPLLAKSHLMRTSMIEGYRASLAVE